MNRVKQVLLGVVLVVLLIAMLQNAQMVTFRFLNWEYDVSQLLLVLIVFLIGFLTGWLVTRWPRRRRDEDLPIR
jgi:uncharacterized membrane protein YciS (DUF1049 family)